jgi:hypothetical protein
MGRRGRSSKFFLCHSGHSMTQYDTVAGRLPDAMGRWGVIEKSEARSLFDGSETRSRQLPVAPIGNPDSESGLVTGLGLCAWWHSSFSGLPIRDTPIPSRGQPALLRTSHSVAVLKLGHCPESFRDDLKAFGFRAWFLSRMRSGFVFSVSSRERCGFGNPRYSPDEGSGRYETRSRPGQQVAQTRFLTGFDRVCPGLAGFARVSFEAPYRP